MKFALKVLFCFVTTCAPICFLISYVLENNRVTKERNELLRIEQLLMEAETFARNLLVEEKQLRSRTNR